MILHVHRLTITKDWGQLFLRAIPANIMVCMAITLSVASRSASGKMIALWFPVVLFVLSGYEHCVADSKRQLPISFKCDKD